MPLTDDQRHAVEQRDGPLLLAAGAGSGKTSVMVQRFAATVLEDGVAVDRILAITFTEKAAEELKQRVRNRLLEAGRQDLARAAESAAVSTIHGFCARLLRTHALDAGLDPYASVLDEREAGRLRAAAFDAALRDVLAPEGPDGAIDVVAAYGPPRLRGMVLEAHGQLRSAGETEPRLPKPPAVDVEAAASAARRAAAEAAAELAAAGEGKTLDAAREALAAVPDARHPTPAALDALKLPRNGCAALTSPACERYRIELAAWRQAVVDERAADTIRVLDALLGAFSERYAAVKREAAGLDFDDLELGVRDLLVRRDDLRQRWAGRFDAVMVDEFQDVNPLQAEILDLLGRDRLFAVGDRLQSIYGFRHADVGIFDRAAESLQDQGRYATLQANFRAKREVLDAIDLAFDDAFGPGGFLPLEAGREDADADDGSPPVELLLCDQTGWDDLDSHGAPPWRQAEAQALADRIRAELDAGRPPGDVVVLLRATSDMGLYERALTDRDIPTYLIGGRGFWSTREVQDLVAWLSLVANPYDEPRLWEVLASPLVDARSDDLVLVKALARAAESDPWTALSGALSGGEGSGEAVVWRGSEGGRAKLARFVERLRLERAAAARCSLEELLDRAVAATGYDLALLRAPGGRRRLANVRKLLRLARAHEAAEGPDLRGFLDSVARLARGEAAGDREGEAPVEGDTVHAVRLMTIHRAKGLEFPVVCVADLGRARPNGHGPLRVSGDGRIGLRLTTLGGGSTEPAFAWGELSEEDTSADAAEERRLFYVAATRARERLILSGVADLDNWPDPLRGPTVAWLFPAFLGEVPTESTTVRRERDGRAVRLTFTRVQPKGVKSFLATPKAPHPGQMSATRPDDPATTPGPALADVARKDLTPLGAAARLSYSALEDFARCGYRYHLQRVLGLPDEPPPPGVPAAPGLPGTVRGTIVHTLLEALDFADPRPPATGEVTELARREGHRVPAGEANEIAALAGGLKGTAIAKRLAAADSLRREEGFAFLIEDGPAAGLLLTGALDVLATEPNGDALVVDWKSDRVAGEDLDKVVERSYTTQRIVYALAALRAGAATVHVVHCFLERPAEPVTATFTGEDIARLEDEIATRALPLLKEEFAPTPTPHRDLCATCPGRPALCSWDEAMTLRAPPDPHDAEVRVTRAPVQERLF